MRLRIVVLVAATLGASGSFAAQAQQNTSASSGTTAAKPIDPNEVVCERQEVIGSRLATKKVCMTRSQWADAKAQDRQDVEKAQTMRGDIAPK
jgi:hypothetical protein